jgi:Tfp pilus assembly protein FimT
VKTAFKLLTVVAMIGVMAGMAAPAFAQTTNTRTITESEINSAYWVTNPTNRAVTNRSVDLQAGKVVVSATVTRRGKDPVQVVTTYVPTITNGRVYWSVTAKTRNGQAVPADVLAQINAHISASWRNFFKQKAGAGRITSIVITDTTITITATK